MRRFLRFSLRTLLILVLLIGSAATVWWHWTPWVLVATTRDADVTTAFDAVPRREPVVVRSIQNDDGTFAYRLEHNGREIITVNHLQFAFPAFEPPVLSPQEKFIAVATSAQGGRRKIAIWDTATRKALFDGVETLAHQANFSNDDRLAAFTLDDAVEIRTLPAGATQCLIHTGRLVGVAGAQFSPDGTRVLVSQWEGYAGVWDCKTGECLAVLENNEMTYTYGTFPSDDKILILDDAFVLHEWRRRHPETTLGVLHLPELWLGALFLLLLLWSVRRDWRVPAPSLR